MTDRKTTHQLPLLPLMMKWLRTGQSLSIAALLLVTSASGIAAQEASERIMHALRPDFAGSWEKDYNRSDKWDNELDRQIGVMLRRQQNPQAASGVRLGGARRSAPGELVELARLAEFISRHNVMDIKQSASEVVVERQGEAALICGTRLDVMESFSSPYGNEICGWERNQLVFHISLPEAVDIVHRFSVSDDGGWLNMLTSISRDNSEPFNLIQVFRRFDMPNAGEYNCVQTLGRGQVCSALGTGDNSRGTLTDD